MFPAKAWFLAIRLGERLIKTVLSVGANGLQARPGDWTLRANDRGRLLDFLGFKLKVPQRWGTSGSLRPLADLRTAATTSARHLAFAEDASRIRKNPDIAARLRSFAYNLYLCAAGRLLEHPKRSLVARRPRLSNLILQLPRLH